MASVNRLSSPSAFRSVFSPGRSYAQGAVVLYVAKRTTGSGPARTGLVVSRKVGGAVARNRAKRLPREGTRLEGRDLTAGRCRGLLRRHGRRHPERAQRGRPARRGRGLSDPQATTPRPSRPAAVLV